ncbi:hypothetical protein Tco_0867190 [Tanacetum coccineum]
MEIVNQDLDYPLSEEICPYERLCRSLYVLATCVSANKKKIFLRINHSLNRSHLVPQSSKNAALYYYTTILGIFTIAPLLKSLREEDECQRAIFFFPQDTIGLLFFSFDEDTLVPISIDQGPFELGTTRDTLRTTPEGGVLLGPERPRTYEDLSDTEKKRYNADVRAANIVLQGLPKDIYKLVNHNIEAKAIWDNVKMLLAGESINEYYVRFHKLVNDMRNIRMTMPNIQLNSKFVNNMSPKSDRFVTAVKLNKGLKKTNHEQLYAYLKQHEKHAAQDRLIIERITPATNDQLAFMSTVQPHAQSSHVQSHQ